MKKIIEFDIKALNGAVDVIRKYGGNKARLSELQIKELEKVIEFTLDYVTETHVTSDSAVERLVSEVRCKLRLRGIRAPLTFRHILEKIVERGVSDNEEVALELSRSRGVSLSDYMSTEELLQEIPKLKEVENVKTKKYEVAYEVGGVLRIDEIECNRVDVGHSLVEYYNGDKCVAIYNKGNFVRAILL